MKNQTRKIFTLFFICGLLVISSSLNGCSSSLEIVSKPISFSEERIELTKDYIKEHYGAETENISIVPKIIVLHWTAIKDFEGSFRAFDREKLPKSRTAIISAGAVNVSIHYLVDKDGTVYNLMPDTLMARHCIGLNYNSIGLENVGGENGIDNMTDEQIESNIKLVRYLAEKYSSIEYLIGHYEYTLFEGHPLWLELDENYRTGKSDPGERFMKTVRENVEDLNLKGPKEIAEEIKASEELKISN